DSADNDYVSAPEDKRARMREEARKRTEELNERSPNQWREFFLGKAADPDFNFREAMQVDAGISGNRSGTQITHDVAEEAKALGGAIESALSVTGRPKVDRTELQETLSL